MSWLGKVVGGAFGFLMGGPLGAVFGAAMGHQYDQSRGGQQSPFRAEVESAEQYRAQMAFFTAVFAVMGHLAKADGRVNEAEIEQARRIMARLQLNEAMRKTAMRLFGEGKREDFDLEEALDLLRAAGSARFSLIRAFVEFQLELALADGALHAAEERLLLRMCERLHFSRFEFHALKAALEAQLRVARGNWRGRQAYGRALEPSLEECYAALGVSAAAGDAEIRRAYRRLLSRHHPDKLAAAGGPEEKVRLANDKTREIRKAWETVRKARNL
jgi:DnaJ like chaperone protein